MIRGTKELETSIIGHSGRRSGNRAVPIEAPVSIEYNGLGYAVMMASPVDLEDFGLGFSVSEGLARSADDVKGISVFRAEKGWILRIQLVPSRIGKVAERVRTRASESSCGLCGLENLEQVMRPIPQVKTHINIPDAALFRALHSLRQHQELNAATGGVHGAALCSPAGMISIVREDVGRHNALDKLIGAALKAKVDPGDYFLLLSSRCSYELVEKTVMAGFPQLVTISTATTLAVERARHSGLKLVALARSDSMIDFTSI